MKRVREVGYFKNIRQIHEFEFGIFYFFDGIVISEINEGVIFTFKMAEKIIKTAHEIFGSNAPITYISNRVNTYYVMPFHWLKLYRETKNIYCFSVVGKTKGSFLSLLMERLVFNKSIPTFTDLEEAITWSLLEIAKKKTPAI